MKHLKAFAQDTEYQNFINGPEKVLPCVSLCISEDEIHYNPVKKIDNYIQLSIISPYAPGGVGAAAPKIAATCDYPVGKDITISGTCSLSGPYGSGTANFNITILRGADNGVDEIEYGEINTSLGDPYYITSINSYACNVTSDSTYKYYVIVV